MNQSTIILDLRDDIRKGQETFAKITAAIARL